MAKRLNYFFRSTSLFHVSLSVNEGSLLLKSVILHHVTNDTECHFA